MNWNKKFFGFVLLSVIAQHSFVWGMQNEKEDKENAKQVITIQTLNVNLPEKMISDLKATWEEQYTSKSKETTKDKINTITVKTNYTNLELDETIKIFLENHFSEESSSNTNATLDLTKIEVELINEYFKNLVRKIPTMEHKSLLFSNQKKEILEQRNNENQNSINDIPSKKHEKTISNTNTTNDMITAVIKLLTGIRKNKLCTEDVEKEIIKKYKRGQNIFKRYVFTLTVPLVVFGCFVGGVVLETKKPGTLTGIGAFLLGLLAKKATV